jgi:hypothetical protein
MAIYDCGICLSDIDKSKILIDKNGKEWYNFKAVEYSGKLELQERQTTEEKLNKVPYKKVGRGQIMTTKVFNKAG